jgi:hypothetical protein
MQWRLLESNLRFVPETIDFRPLHAVARGRGLHTDMRSRWLISNPAVFFDTVNAKLDRVGLARRRRTQRQARVRLWDDRAPVART